ncbi:MAG: hypothetical protein OXI17_12270 [Gammaproteobacteria bacterium]|nr:hypothetical protein [Gammaproteobacteria bacterium]
MDFSKPIDYWIKVVNHWREITTENGGRIDILTIDADGDLTIVEVKRDRTPRDVVAQILDYASWVSSLNSKNIREIYSNKNSKSLEDAFYEKFGQPLPDVLNGNHHLVIVASEFDPSSARIVKYLADKHSVAINTVFFSIFDTGEHQFLATEWLMDQDEVIERSESRQRPPWSGYYYINAGLDENVRVWEDMKTYGFIAAGYGSVYSNQLERLAVGDPVYVYHKGYGYIGFGVVISQSAASKEFRLPDGRKLTEVELNQPGILHDPDDPELADYIVGVEWKKTFPIEDAKTFPGIFANPNIVCKLTNPATLDFLAKSFGTIN